MTIPRGFRNNNPGNLRITGMAWQGKVPVEQNTDKAFEQFVSLEYGLRVMIVVLRTYIKRKGLDTIEKIIPVYAPATENDVEAYIQVVSLISGLQRDAVIDFTYEDMHRLVHAMVYHENGRALPSGVFDRAWAMLFPKSKEAAT
jgi:hypothetical protein